MSKIDIFSDESDWPKSKEEYNSLLNAITPEERKRDSELIQSRMEDWLCDLRAIRKEVYGENEINNSTAEPFRRENMKERIVWKKMDEKYPRT